MSEPQILAWRIDCAHQAIPIDLTIYSLDAVFRAAYKLTDRCFVWVSRDEGHDQRAIVYLIGRSATNDLTGVALEFRNELLDQQLRCRLEAQFADVRTLIVAQAFSEGNLIDPQSDDGDYRADPDGAGTHR